MFKQKSCYFFLMRAHECYRTVNDKHENRSQNQNYANKKNKIKSYWFIYTKVL